jgi:predicted Zn-dependent protease
MRYADVSRALADRSRATQEQQRALASTQRKAQTALAHASKFLVELPGSRRNEMEADLVGLKLMGIAKYDVRKSPVVFAKMGASAGPAAMRKLTAFVSTHPHTDVRVVQLEKELKRMKALNYNQESYTRVLAEIPRWT